MASEKEINIKVRQIEEATAHLAQLASELKAMTGVSTPVLKRPVSRAKMEMRAIMDAKFKKHSNETPSKK